MATAGGESDTAVGVGRIAVGSETQQSNRPELAARRKSSFSDAFSKITTNPFNRRRTTTLVQSSSSSAFLIHPSRIPTPLGISRSTSFLSTLSAFTSRTPSINDGSEDSEQSAIAKPSRKISDRLAQTPFFNCQHQRINTSPFLNKQKRELGVQIEQRGLMAPLHPPLPRSSTMGNLGQGQCAQHSPNTPSFMRSTSSSAAHRTSLNTPKPRNTPMPTIPSGKTPTSASRIPTAGFGGSSKPASGRDPTPSTTLASSSVTPTNERRVSSFGRGPSSSFMKTKDRPTPNQGRSMTSGSHALTIDSSCPSGRNSGLPSPQERRMGWRQGKKAGRRLASSLRRSDHGNGGTSELMAFEGLPVKDNLTGGAVKASNHNIAHINIVVPASSNGNIQKKTSTHPRNVEAEDSQQSANFTAIDDDKLTATHEIANLPFPLRDMSNPRLASPTHHPPFPLPSPLLPIPSNKTLTTTLPRSTPPCTPSNGPVASPPSPTASVPAPSPPHPPPPIFQTITPPLPKPQAKR
jgi:hypothetical protein